MIELENLSSGERIDRLSDRARISFAISIGVFVLVISFFYGFSKGLSRTSSLAHARASLSPSVLDNFELPDGLLLPSGVIPVPLGKNVRINDKHVQIVSFFSRRSVSDLVKAQFALWSDKNIKFVHRISERRAVVLGTDQSTGQKYSLMIWVVPPTLRRVVSEGYPVQGTLAISDKEAAGAFSELPVAGEVPGVPVMPGGSGGAVFSSDDVGGRSHTGVYTNPGTLEKSMLFYRNELRLSGWQETKDVPSQSPLGTDFAQQHFIRGSHEISLLYSTPKAGVLEQGDVKTIVTVILSGQMPKV